QLDYVRMAQGGHGSCLAVETLHFFGPCQSSIANLFQSYDSFRFRVARAVNDSHSTGRQLLQKFIAAESGYNWPSLGNRCLFVERGRRYRAFGPRIRPRLRLIGQAVLPGINGQLWADSLVI